MQPLRHEKRETMTTDDITPEQLLAMLDSEQIDLTTYLDSEPLPVLIDDPLPLITDIT